MKASILLRQVWDWSHCAMSAPWLPGNPSTSAHSRCVAGEWRMWWPTTRWPDCSAPWRSTTSGGRHVSRSSESRERQILKRCRRVARYRTLAIVSLRPWSQKLPPGCVSRRGGPRYAEGLKLFHSCRKRRSSRCNTIGSATSTTPLGPLWGDKLRELESSHPRSGSSDRGLGDGSALDSSWRTRIGAARRRHRRSPLSSEAAPYALELRDGPGPAHRPRSALADRGRR